MEKISTEPQEHIERDDYRKPGYDPTGGIKEELPVAYAAIPRNLVIHGESLGLGRIALKTGKVQTGPVPTFFRSTRDGKKTNKPGKHLASGTSAPPGGQSKSENKSGGMQPRVPPIGGFNRGAPPREWGATEEAHRPDNLHFGRSVSTVSDRQISK